jgi:polyribonucleotide nucleotidyltransferase
MSEEVHLLLATIPARRPSVSRLLVDLSQQSVLPDCLHLVLDGYGEDAAPSCATFPEGVRLSVVRTPAPSGPGGRWKVALGMPADALLVVMDDDQRLCAPDIVETLVRSVRERGGGLNRRMTGHGALAEKALSAVIPPKEDFPYTIRLVSEAFASNGSTSMASVCGSTLAMMDGGVPIKAPVAGIAMGVIYENPERYAVLTDIQGPEDHYGDMDFKVAGTKDGVTAIQLDVKVEGIPLKVLAEALGQAKRARLQILDVMIAEIASPRPNLSPRAPKIVTLSVPVDMIGLVIGPGGKNIKKIEEETGVTGITIEEDGTIFVTGVGDAPEAAAQIIRDQTRVWKPGDTVEGPVTRLMNFGAFVRLAGKTEGLVHISEIAPFRIATVEEALQVGDIVKVVVKEIDDQGRINLSIKMIDPEFAARKGLKAAEGNPEQGRGGYNDRNGRRPGNNSGGGHRW